MKIISYETYLTKDGLAKLNIVAENNYDAEKFEKPEIVKEMMNTLFHVGYKTEEHVYLLCFSQSLTLRGVFLISKGTVSKSLLSPREIIQKCLLCNATGFILMHNHPGGNTSPSSEDIKATKIIKEAANLFDMPLYDHIIISGEDFFSMKQYGML